MKYPTFTKIIKPIISSYNYSSSDVFQFYALFCGYCHFLDIENTMLHTKFL